MRERHTVTAPKQTAKERNPFVATIIKGRIVYGKKSRWGIEEWRHTMRGDLRRTENTWECAQEDLREITTWRKKVVGIAESFFPHPGDWRLGGQDLPLDQASVRSMTKMFASFSHVPPSCLEAWRSRIGELPPDVGHRYNTRLLTPRDWASHFKNVLHRTLLVRSITTEDPCRCCNHARENLQHFPSCDVAGEIFKELHTLTGTAPLRTVTERERFGLFALHPTERLKEGWVNLHLLLWKHLVAAIVKVELEEEKYRNENVWAPTWKRLERKVLALLERVQSDVRRKTSRGEPVPDMRRRSRPIEPIASFDEGGNLIWNEEIKQKLKELGKPKPEAARRQAQVGGH